MTTKAVNDTLSRVGPDTPMGRLLREYWMPVLRSERLVERGGAPVPVQLLGQHYVIFRADDGRLGCFDAACPHRGASLALARNEDCALRCIYHGWKFDVSGQVLETPSEPAELDHASKVSIGHHPVREAGGIIWVWLGGTGREPNPFPAFSFTDLPADHVYSFIAILECNWMQGLEADVDSAHVSLLHETEARQGALRDLLEDRAPRDEIEVTASGLRFAALRTMNDGQQLVRIKPFVMPWYTIVPELPSGDRLWHAWVPIDDHRTIMWYLWYNEDHPVDPSVFAAQFGFDPATIDHDNFRAGYSRENMWGQDRAAMRSGESFSGIRGLAMQDIAVQESMGAIVDRTRESPGKSDTGIARTRKVLLDAIKKQVAGAVAPGLGDDVDYAKVRSASFTIPPEESWQNAIA